MQTRWQITLMLLCAGFCTQAQLPANCNGITPRMAIAGDSWAQYMADDGWHNDVFKRYGHGDKLAISETYESEILCTPSPGPLDYAVFGSKAREWADEVSYDYLQNLIDALNDNVDVDMVLLSIGGNDILAGRSEGRWYKDMDLDNLGSEQALFDTIEAHTRYIIEQLWARSRSGIGIIISGYDYPNFNVSALWCGFYACGKREDLSRDANSNGSIDGSELITDAEINLMMLGVENIRKAMADTYPLIYYDNGMGLMHHYYGYNDGLYPSFGEGSTSVPEGTSPYVIGGDITYPTDRNNFRLVGICGIGSIASADPIHLDAQGYEIKIKNQFDNIIFEHYRGAPDMTFWSQDGEDGYVDIIGNSTNSSGIRVGDDGPFCCSGGADNDYRGIFSFNTSDIPDNAVIDGASLYLIRSGVDDNPFLQTDRSPVLDIVNGHFGTNPSLEVLDGSDSADFENIGCFHGEGDEDDYAIRVDIDDSALSAINLEGLTQMRFYFDYSDWSVEYINFYDGGGQATFAPPSEFIAKYATRKISKKPDIYGNTKSEILELGEIVTAPEGYEIQEKLISVEEMDDGSVVESYRSVLVLSHPGLVKYMLDNYGAPGGGAAPFLDVSYTLLLPVELLDFNAIKEGGQSLLTWSTASQINFKGFDIEHKTDQTDWAALQFLASTMESSELMSYVYEHSDPVAGINHYRLKMIDEDGRFDYSGIQSVYFDNDDFLELSVSPNPVTDYLTWYLYVDRDQSMDIALFDATGKVVVHDQRLADGRYSAYTMDVSKLTSGIYFIRLSTAQKVYFTTISKK